jgi:DNA replication protein DnaC
VAEPASRATCFHDSDRELRSRRFLHEASNMILLGPPGVGKTHLSVALAEATIQSGFGAYFMTAHDRVADLGRRIGRDGWTGACESTWRRRF